MSAMDAWLSGPSGTVLAIAAMALVTYLCRAAGVVVMSRIPITPRVERGLRALPGSIVVATVLPLALDGGITAALALASALAAMIILRHELAALASGLAVVSALRAFGL
jgi:uncharacterized membrane protein